MAEGKSERVTNANVREGTDMSQRLGMYSFYDVEGNVYDTPFFCKDDLHARRHFLISIDQKGSMLAKFIDSFRLIKLGEFDKVNGELVTKDSFYVVLKGSQIAKEMREDAISNEA